METEENKEERRLSHEKKVKAKREWAYFAGMIIFLAVINWQTSPDYWWVLWVAFSWGFVLLLDRLVKCIR